MVFDANAIAGVVSGFKAATELAQLAIDARDAGVIRAKAIELQREIFAAQSSALTAQADQFALLNRVNELEKEVADLRAWDTEKQNYKLVELRKNVARGHGGALAYALKEETDLSEPVHLLCPECFENRRKSVLQQETRFPGNVDFLYCLHCGSEINRTGVRYEKTPIAGAPRRQR